LVIEEGENVEERGFSRSGRSHDGKEVALFDFEIHSAQDPGLAGAGFVTAFDIF
jgi:hypothetical protein